MISRSLRLALAALALPVLLASCGNVFGPNEDARDLAAAKKAWAAQRVASYTLVVQPRCYCGQGSLRATVVNGVVTERVIVETGAPAPPALFGSIESVDAMLATLERAVREHAHEIRATYDTHGVPQQAYIDWDANTADEESGWQVVSLTPAP